MESAPDEDEDEAEIPRTPANKEPPWWDKEEDNDDHDDDDDGDEDEEKEEGNEEEQRTPAPWEKSTQPWDQEEQHTHAQPWEESTPSPPQAMVPKTPAAGFGTQKGDDISTAAKPPPSHKTTSSPPTTPPRDIKTALGATAAFLLVAIGVGGICARRCKKPAANKHVKLDEEYSAEESSMPPQIVGSIDGSPTVDGYVGAGTGTFEIGDGDDDDADSFWDDTFDYINNANEPLKGATQLFPRSSSPDLDDAALHHIAGGSGTVGNTDGDRLLGIRNVEGLSWSGASMGTPPRSHRKIATPAASDEDDFFASFTTVSAPPPPARQAPLTSPIAPPPHFNGGGGLLD